MSSNREEALKSAVDGFAEEMRERNAQREQDALVTGAILIFITVLATWIVTGWFQKRISHNGIVVVLSLFVPLIIVFSVYGFAMGSIAQVLANISDFGSRPSNLFLMFMGLGVLTAWVRLLVIAKSKRRADAASVETFK